MMRQLILCSVLIGASAHAVMSPDGRLWSGQHQDPSINRLIVKPSGGVIAATDGMDGQTVQAARAAFVKQAALEATGMEMQVLRHLATGAVLLELPVSVSLQQAKEYAGRIAGRLGDDGGYAEPDSSRWSALMPDDTHYSNFQGHLQAPTDGGPGAANLPDAWDITTGGSDIVVAVIDTGALDHADLRGRFVQESVVHSGRDFLIEDSGRDNHDGRDHDPTDSGNWHYGSSCRYRNSSWHGSHVAGTIGAETDNGLHVAGVDWQARLLIARVLGECGGVTSDIADAIIWSAGTTVDGVANPNPARVLNLSLGGDGVCSATEQDAIDAAVAQGATVVVAAGNSDDDVADVSPANCNNVITVAAVDSRTGERAWFSSYGEEVEIAAPGVSIPSTVNSGMTTAVAEDGDFENHIGDIYTYKSGTSMATPHVSGVVALMLAANQAAGGDLMADARKAETSSRITAKLQASARAFLSISGAYDCTTSTCGAGYLDGHQAVVAVSTAPSVNAGSDQSVAGGASVTLSANVSDDAYNTTTTWQWTQTAGTPVSLNNADSATAGFIAPAVNETLTFTVTATDDTGLTDTDSVEVQVSRAGSDTTPDAFNFIDRTDVSRMTTFVSNAITVSGIDAPASISLEGDIFGIVGEFSVNGGAYTRDDATVNNGDTVSVRHQSAPYYATSMHTVLVIGGVSGTFMTTTEAAPEALPDAPDAFSFVDRTDVALDTWVVSNAITVSGIDGPPSIESAPISISGSDDNSAPIKILGPGSYSINDGPYTRVKPAMVRNGDTVTMRHRSSAYPATPTHSVLVIGGVSETFTSTTQARSDDTVPDAFDFVDRTDVARKTTITSNTITVSGIDAPTSISLKGNGFFSVNGGAYTRDAATVNNGDTVNVRHRSSAYYATSVYTVLTIGGVSETFRTTTEARSDTTPDAFNFVDRTNVRLRTRITSNTITVSGIDAPAPISLKGNGFFSVNGGAYTRRAATVNNGDTVSVRHWSSVYYGTPVYTVLTIGGVSETFRTTTKAPPDITPNAFNFVDRIDVALDTEVTSNIIGVSGINAPTPISLRGNGFVSVNGGPYTRIKLGKVTNGDIVSVRHRSSRYYETPVYTVLTIGGVSETFKTTTRAASMPLPNAPDAFRFVDRTGVAPATLVTSNAITVSGLDAPAPISMGGTGLFNINGGDYRRSPATVSNGDKVTVRYPSSVYYLTPVHGVLTIGGISDTFTTTTGAQPDTTPDAFQFVDRTDVALKTWFTSNAITVSGLNAPAWISMSGTGLFNINGGDYRRSATMVSNGDTVTVRHKSSAYPATPTYGVLTIGGGVYPSQRYGAGAVSATFMTTTEAKSDTTPDAFSFVAQVDVALKTWFTSNAITVSGLNASASISMGGTGLFNINGGDYRRSPATVRNGDTVTVRHESSAHHSTPTHGVLIIGGVSDTFTTTTVAKSDAMPDAFSFVDQTGVARGAEITSNAGTVSGIEAPASISLKGSGRSGANGGAYTRNATTMKNGVNANDYLHDESCYMWLDSTLFVKKGYLRVKGNRYDLKNWGKIKTREMRARNMAMRGRYVDGRPFTDADKACIADTGKLCSSFCK